MVRFNALRNKIKHGVHEAVNHRQLQTLHGYLDENNSIFQTYTGMVNGEKGGYDIDCATVDIGNITTNADGLRAIAVSTSKQGNYQFKWNEVSANIARLGDEAVAADAYDISRKSWVATAQRLARFTGTITPGFTALANTLPMMVNSPEKEKPKKPKARNKINEEARKKAERLAQGASDEQALANVEYDQDNGQVSNLVLAHVKDCIVNTLNTTDSARAGYWECVIDRNSFAKTIENMFHVSFLVKKKELALMVDRQGNAHLVNLSLTNAPRRKRVRLEDQPETDTVPVQSLTSIDMSEWNMMKDVLSQNGIVGSVITDMK